MSASALLLLSAALGRLRLAAIWHTAASRFAELLSLLPELLEPYQAEGAQGGTVRRFAILHPAPTEQQPQPQQQQPRQQEGGEEEGVHQRQHQQQLQRLQQNHQKWEQEREQPLHAAQPLSLEAALLLLPTAMARELADVHRRYPACWLTIHEVLLAAHPLPMATAGRAAAGTAGVGTAGCRAEVVIPPAPAASMGAAAAAVGLSGLSVSGTQAATTAAAVAAPAAAAAGGGVARGPSHHEAATPTGQGGATGGHAVRFSLQILPTDPSWDKSVALTLYCSQWAAPAGAGGGPADGGGDASMGSGAAVPLGATVSVRRPVWCHVPQQEQQEQEGGHFGRLTSRQQQRQPAELQLSELEAEAFDRLLAAAAAAAAAAPPPPTLPPAPRPGGAAAAMQRAAAGMPLSRQPLGPGRQRSLFLGMLRHVENHAGTLLQEAQQVAAEVAARRRAVATTAAAADAGAMPVCAPRAGRPGQGAPMRKATRGSSSSSSSSSSQGSDGGAGGGGGYSSSFSSSGSEGEGSPWGSEAEEEEEEAGGEGGGGAGHSAAVLAGGLDLALAGLELVDCDALELLRLNLQVGGRVGVGGGVGGKGGRRGGTYA